ncbi:hypothetical protein [Pleionea litopenaei]|uniref:Uncharacterized protein n=1 Tax=Pleionea litopenaei TaxID=3070815 RepID=A0AA51RWC2_9GAMM|nr:hypothetical protein [Pleionea sp. HL-JVS1]WMS88802.1 hypothetical protein Q9312_07750 [Pleionea sp. HL-JVS1]
MNEEKSRRMELRRQTGTREVAKLELHLKHRGPEYLIAFACFNCQKSFKKPAPDKHVKYKCNECRLPLYMMGRNFTAPRKGNSKQWKKVQWLYAYGFRFLGSGLHDGAELPKKLSDLKSFLSENPNHPLRVADIDEFMLKELLANEK